MNLLARYYLSSFQILVEKASVYAQRKVALKVKLLSQICQPFLDRAASHQYARPFCTSVLERQGGTLPPLPFSNCAAFSI